MKIILNNSGTLTTLDTIMTGSVRDGIDGEYTIDFTIIGQEAFLIDDNTTVQYDGQYFNVINYAFGEHGIQPTCNVKCEHVSYTLNEAIGNGIDYTGSPVGLLNLIFGGTPFKVGIIESSQQIATSIHGNTYCRTVLNNLAGTIGCEVEYDGYNINLRQHRGSIGYIELLDTKNVTDVSKSRDVLKDLTTYNVTLGRRTILKAGDNIHIKYDPLHLDDYTRIIAIDYNPYDPFEVSIDVGAYVPDILDELNAAEQAAAAANEIANQANDTANQANDTANQVYDIANQANDTANQVYDIANQANDTATAAADKVESFDVRITDAQNNVAEMKLDVGKFEVRLAHAEGDIDGMPSTIEAVIQSGITDSAGSIKLFVEGKNFLTQPQADGSYLKISNLSAGISTYINGATGKAEVVSACSSTYQTISDMNGYVTNNTLDTSIGQYIDSQAGKAKIISACSATYQTISGMNGYVTTTSLNTSIGQYIDGTTGTAKIISACSGTYATTSSVNTISQTVTQHTSQISLVVGTGKLVGTAGKVDASIVVAAVNGASSSVKIDADHIVLTGLVTITDLSASGRVTINGGNITAGTISADRIDANSLRVNKIYDTGGSQVMLSTSPAGSAAVVYLGGDSSRINSASVYIQSSRTIYLTNSTSGFAGLTIDFSYKRFRNATSSAQWDLGEIGNTFATAYIDTLSGKNVNVTAMTASTINGITISTLTTPGKLYYNHSASYYVEMYSNSIFRPNSNNSIDCGASSYRWKTIYTTNLDISGTFAAYTARLGGNSSYYIVANTSRELRPDGTSSSYPCYLGTSSYPWHYAYIGSNTALVGTSTSSSLGFFGKSPVSRPSVATVSTGGTLANAITGINNVITALKNLGLIA